MQSFHNINKTKFYEGLHELNENNLDYNTMQYHTLTRTRTNEKQKLTGEVDREVNQNTYAKGSE